MLAVQCPRGLGGVRISPLQPGLGVHSHDARPSSTLKV